MKINYEEGETIENTNIDYKTIIDKWMIETTIIAKIFNFIRQYPDGVSKMVLEEYIRENTNTTNPDFYKKEPYRAKYNIIYTFDKNETIQLTNEAKQYISTL